MEAVLLRKTPKPKGKIISLPAKQQDEESLTHKISLAGKLVFPTISGFECLHADDILFLRAQGNYTIIHTRDKRIMLSQTIKHVVSKLPSLYFFRVHKSYVINARYVKSYNGNCTDPHLQLDNDVCIPVSRSRKKDIR